MCLVFLAYRSSPVYSWVIAGNRDEYHNRPTAELSYIDSSQTIIGGRDLQEGGMWLGVSTDGKIGVVTNFREGGAVKTPDQASRGEIVLRYLKSGDSARSAIKRLAGESDRYSGFNVIFGDTRQMLYFSNRENRIRSLVPGFYGLSNRFLDSDWPKVRRGKALLHHLMCNVDVIDTDAVISCLNDCEQPGDDTLPDTGVGLELERFLSPMMILGENYGTRSSAVVSMTCHGAVNFVERSYLPGGAGCIQTSQKTMRLQVGQKG